MKLYESFAHFMNVVKYVKKKRKQCTYISQEQYDLLTEIYNTDEAICSAYIDYCRKERYNTEINLNHLTVFLNRIGYLK